MSKFMRIDTPLDGVYVIEPSVFGDERGFFMETYAQRDFDSLGITEEFVQDNHSKSKRGVLRGLHFQTKQAQSKLVRCIAGAVYDVAVDLRCDSPSFAHWFGIELSAVNKKQLYIPKGCAHGFLTLYDDSEFLYKCTDYYAPQYDSGVLWSDTDIAVDWQFQKYGFTSETIILSDKDKKQNTLRHVIESGILKTT